MIEFFKHLLSKINFKSDNEDLNKLNKIIYSVLILCAILFIGFIVYFVIRQWPDFVEAVKENWNDLEIDFRRFQ